MSNRILFLAGSTRKTSLNKQLAKAAHSIAIEQGLDATFIDLSDYEMPIYNGDLEGEKGLPDNAVALKKLFLQHDALFISSPEYNGSFSPLLKNTLDWVSRPHQKDEARLSAYQDKVAAIAAASGGGLGGLRGLVPLRMLLENISTVVIPEQFALSKASQAFDDQGQLIDEQAIQTLTTMVMRLASIVR